MGYSDPVNVLSGRHPACYLLFMLTRARCIGDVIGSQDVLNGSHGWLSHSHPPTDWLAADVLDDANQACGGDAQLYNFDAVAYESVVIGAYESVVLRTSL